MIMNEHDIILKIIQDIKEDIKKSCEIKTNKHMKEGTLLPSFCFRTGELYPEICKRLNGNDIAAESLIFECFGCCTLTTFYYIHLNDLATIIERHKETGEWCVKLL